MNEQASGMLNQHQHQHQQQMMNITQNPQMMGMNQHQPQQQVSQTLNYGLSRPNLTNTNNYKISNANHLKRPRSTNNQQMVNHLPQQMINHSYGLWAPPMLPPDQLKFQNPIPNIPAAHGSRGFVFGKQQPQVVKPLGPRSNWKGKKVNDKRKDGRRKDNISMPLMAATTSGPPGGIAAASGGGYRPPMLKELQHQNKVKTQRFFTRKKFNSYRHHDNNNDGGNNMGKFAPRNTSSFIIRAKKSGGIPELVSPCQGTPAVLPTPMFSPSREVLVDMAKEEWGVDGYGSMKGLIRLRSPGREDELHEGEDEEEEGGSSESDVEEHVEVERRLDHDLSRFEIVYPSYAGGVEYNNVLENRVDDQDTHIAQLEEENLILKERLYLMQRELSDLSRRMQFLERRSHCGGEDFDEEVMENESENDNESRGEAHCMEENKEDLVDHIDGCSDAKGKHENKDVDGDVKAARHDQNDAVVENKEVSNDGGYKVKDGNVCENVEVKEENDDDKDEKEEKSRELNVVGSENVAIADDFMEDGAKAENDWIVENQSKDVTE